MIILINGTIVMQIEISFVALLLEYGMVLQSSIGPMLENHIAQKWKLQWKTVYVMSLSLPLLLRFFSAILEKVVFWP